MPLYFKGKELHITEEWPFTNPCPWVRAKLDILADGYLVECGTRVCIVRDDVEECVIDDAIVIGMAYTDDVLGWGCK
jgi:hypothetical protein